MRALLETVSFSLSANAAGVRQPLYTGLSTGFQIVADPRNRGSYPLRLQLRGAGNNGMAEVYIVGPSWQHVHTQEISAIPLRDNEVGDWFLTHSQGEDAFISPVPAPVVPADLPAVIGGGFPAASVGPALTTAQLFSEAQALTRAAPTLATEGQAIVGASVFQAWLDAGVGNTVDAGAVDIWRYDTAAEVWMLVIALQGVPTGARRVGIPLDSFLLRNSADRWLVACNGIVLSAGTPTVYMRIQ